MKYSFGFLFCFFTLLSFSQEKIVWDENYQLQLSDFKSPASKIDKNTNQYNLLAEIQLGFQYQMTNYELMFRKNFNQYVLATFSPATSYILAPNSDIASQLLEFSKVQFNLTELYARKFRKRIFEEKKTFSNPQQLMDFYNEVYAELSMRVSQLGIQTDLGRNTALLESENLKIVDEIQQLPDFCATCKPVKKKKKK